MKIKPDSKTLDVAWIILLSIDAIYDIVKIVKRVCKLAAIKKESR